MGRTLREMAHRECVHGIEQDEGNSASIVGIVSFALLALGGWSVWGSL